MRVSIERLRLGLLAGAGLILLATAAFLGYARFRATRFLTELPKKLGADIRQETNAYTYSQTVKGRTVFTVHAAKAVQHKDGKYTLHDVGIVLYGQGGEHPNRVDRIYGSQFEYDPNAGVIRAVGEVHLDLQAPAAADAKAKMDYASGQDLKTGKESDETAKDERLIHVKTSGLVFLRQLGVAATDQDIEFEYGGLTGHAKGADYSSDSGVLVLQSAVKVNGLEQGKPIVLTAAHAELDRMNRKATLTQAKYMTVGGEAQQTAAAQHVVVHTREDGSADRLEAQGAVTLTNGGEVRVVADRGDALLNQQNRPESVRLFGGVEYAGDSPERKARGESQEATASFDGKGELQHVVLNGAVALHERESIVPEPAGQANVLWSERELNASTVELAMSADEKGRAQLQQAKASGNAWLNVVNPAKEGAKHGQGSTSSTMTGDVLTAHFVRSAGAQRLSEVQADGHTSLKQVNEAAAEDTSSGDSLTVKFRDASPRRSRSGGLGAQDGEQISSAVQQRNVVMTRRTVAKPGASADLQRATAQRAVYDGDTERMTLTGGVELSDAGGVLWADHATMEKVSGDATIEGGVKANYRQSAQGEVVHILAQRAELKKVADVAIFYGDAGRPGRLWQGGSQVEAPVLEFAQKERRLVARGPGQGMAMAVHTVLASSGAQPERKEQGDKAAVPAGGRVQGAVRISSREMTYSDEKREADFTGGVQVESKDGTMHGQQAVAYLQPVKAEKAVAANGTAKTGQQGSLFGGSVERVVVTGQIRMNQPGRSATGEQLVYTAGDGMFVLTGSPGVPPKVVDDARGTVTGTELRFHTGDESIVISNGASNGEGPRVHTETRVKR